MNELSKFLVESILNEAPEKVVALFGGGFKPPTKGHLEVVNQGLKNNPEVSEIKILVGGGKRNGFTQDQSVKIWNLYNDIGFIDKPATIIPVSSPFTYYKEYLKNNPDDKVYVFIGSRPGEEKDQFDVKQRSEFVKKYSDNAIPVEVSTGGGVSGTMARELFKTNLDGFRNMFPENLLDKDFQKILDILNNKSTDSTANSTFNRTEPLTPKEENIDPKSQKKHKGKSAPFGSAYEPLNENATYSSKIDYKQQIKDLTKHMVKKGMNILPLPKVIFKHGDQENASQFLGKTAYYSPSDMTVVLYTEGRHPKDIVRSFAHEMIHHVQNLEDRLGGINTTNTMQDDHLNDIEREAYTKGNMTFRNWTDSKDGEEVTSLNEIGDASSKVFSWRKTKGMDPKPFKEITDENVDGIQAENIYEFETDLGTEYVVNFETEYDPDYQELDVEVNFSTIGNLRMDPTNKGEQYAVMATISDIMINWINEWDKYFYISMIWIEPKVEEDEKEEMSVFSQRGRLYKVYLDKQLSRLDKNYEVEQKPNAFKMVPKFENSFYIDETKKKKDPFGLNQYARELMKEFQIEDIKPITETVEKQKEVRIFNKNCNCDKT